VLDPALLRPGRFDRQVVVPAPDIIGREKILKVHVRKVPLAPDVDLKVIARGTPGFSGADLANLVNEGALLAARRGKRVVTQHEFEDAKDKVMMGAERRSMVMTEEEKRNTAYHEAGHAIVGMNMPSHDPLHKVTIIPRGRALGLTMSLPERDALSHTKQWCVANLASVFGGREAELLIFGPDNVTTGATGDIQQATGLARAMVMEWGMSDKLGRIRYRDNQEEVFLGHSVSRAQNISQETAQLIDAEIRRLITEGEETARRILTERVDQLHTLAKGLLEYETLSGQEVRDLLNGKPPVREFTMTEDPPKRRSAVPTTGTRPPRKDPDLGGMEPAPST
jgi:cell division protease FtsH